MSDGESTTLAGSPEAVPAPGAAVLDPRVEEHLSRLVRSTRGTAQVECLRISVTRPGQGPGPGSISREGWHNIVLSPEESRGPGLGHQRLTSTDDPIEVGADAAAAICGLTADVPAQERHPALAGGRTVGVGELARRLDVSPATLRSWADSARDMKNASMGR